MELITLAPQPELSGCFNKQEEVNALLAALTRACEGGEGVDEAMASDGRVADRLALLPLLRRCELWTHEVDSHVAVSSEAIGARAVRELEAEQREGEEERRGGEEEIEVAVDAVGDAAGSGMAHAARIGLKRFHCGGAGTMKSEFKSPPPQSGTLDFARQGAEEIRCFIHVLRHLGAGAPALSSTANGGCSLHVHVNVRHPDAAGDPLSHVEILSCFLAWVRFDQVTTRFARPWMWREPSMAPLYATGSEFCWMEKAWEQGCATASDPATYDVPTFLRAVHRLCREEDFDALDEPAKLERLYGRAPGSPSSGIGRYCSLNLRRLTSYGTLEFRRFHGSLDGELVMRWAHFCVSFVECFRHAKGGEKLLSAASPEEAIEALRMDQERASADDLMEEMAGFVHAETAAFFMRDSGALPCPSTALLRSSMTERAESTEPAE